MIRPIWRRTLRMGSVECELRLAERLAENMVALVEGCGLRPSVLVTDSNVARLYPRCFPDGIPNLVVPAGETSKSLESLGGLLEGMLDAGLDRRGAVVAVGGGVVGDLAGFAAATFMRGVAWVNVPTTLLAMVDASIGGKTAVNIGSAKNLAGAFHAPELVVADPVFFGTLPPAARASGMAEVIKHAMIDSRDLFMRLEAGRFGSTADIIEAIRVKADIVERDPFERGERAKLNLGHTVGHGFESVSGYRLSHGESVALGLFAEAMLAERLGIAEAGLSGRVAAVLHTFGLPSHMQADPSEIRAAMSSDKKRDTGRLKFALPRGIGDVVFGVEVEEDLLTQVLTEACSTS